VIGELQREWRRFGLFRAASASTSILATPRDDWPLAAPFAIIGCCQSHGIVAVVCRGETRGVSVQLLVGEERRRPVRALRHNTSAWFFYVPEAPPVTRAEIAFESDVEGSWSMPVVLEPWSGGEDWGTRELAPGVSLGCEGVDVGDLGGRARLVLRQGRAAGAAVRHADGYWLNWPIEPADVTERVNRSCGDAELWRFGPFDAVSRMPDLLVGSGRDFSIPRWSAVMHSVAESRGVVSQLSYEPLLPKSGSTADVVLVCLPTVWRRINSPGVMEICPGDVGRRYTIALNDRAETWVVDVLAYGRNGQFGSLEWRSRVAREGERSLRAGIAVASGATEWHGLAPLWHGHGWDGFSSIVDGSGVVRVVLGAVGSTCEWVRFSRAET
jgi:hypothetical protein